MVKIITDSSTLYTMQEGRDAGIESIPLCVSIGDSHGRDLQMDMQDFYRRIEEGQIPTSSQPPIGDVLDAYEQYKGRPILNISMADGLSGTYQSAQSAREMAENRDDIMVFNSRTLCGPHRYMVDQARKMAEKGRTRDEILDWLKAAADRTESFLIPQDFNKSLFSLPLYPMVYCIFHQRLKGKLDNFILHDFFIHLYGILIFRIVPEFENLEITSQMFCLLPDGYLIIDSAET